MMTEISAHHSHINGLWAAYIFIALQLHLLWQVVMPFLARVFLKSRRFLWVVCAAYILLAPAFVFMVSLLLDFPARAFTTSSLDLVIYCGILSSAGSLLLMLLALMRLLPKWRAPLAKTHYALFWVGNYLPAVLMVMALVGFFYRYIFN